MLGKSNKQTGGAGSPVGPRPSRDRKKIAVSVAAVILSLLLLAYAPAVFLAAAFGVGTWFLLRFAWRKLVGAKPEGKIAKTLTKKFSPAGRKALAGMLAAFVGLFVIVSYNASLESGQQYASVDRGQVGASAAHDASYGDGSSSSSSVSAESGEGDPRGKGILKAHFIDVGQGDASFYELPDGDTMLVDAGTGSAGSEVVSYIRDLGYDDIDYLVATHPHEDHIGGMPAVFDAFDVGEVWAPRATHNTQAYEDFLQSVSDEGLSMNAASEGKIVCGGASQGYEVDILSPSAGADPGELNDWSAVLSLSFGDTSFLLTGDASASILEEVAVSKVDVLKVGHHGSETSTTLALASRLAPQISVISCGFGNDYGHPDQVVLDALSSSAVYRTDLNGDVVVESDGTDVVAAPAKDADGAALMTSPETEAAKAEAEKAEAEKAEAEAAAAAAAAAAEEPPAAQPSSGGGSDTTVYITNTGEKYHLAGCRHLRKSSIPISLSEAKAQGYGPCGTCKPPA